jgi:hypothetical protein
LLVRDETAENVRCDLVLIGLFEQRELRFQQTKNHSTFTSSPEGLCSSCSNMESGPASHFSSVRFCHGVRRQQAVAERADALFLNCSRAASSRARMLVSDA